MRLTKIAFAVLLSSALTAPIAMSLEKCEGNKCPLPGNLTDGKALPKSGALPEGGLRTDTQGGANQVVRPQLGNSDQVTDQNKRPDAGAAPAEGQAAGEADKKPVEDQAAAGETDKTETGSVAEAPTEITTEQKAEIKNSVADIEVNRIEVNFDINVGVAVPTRVELRPVPTIIVQLVPAYQGYLFFVTADGRIVIVAPDTREIVYVIV